jgi:tRNA pseudouridine55 synthase
VGSLRLDQAVALDDLQALGEAARETWLLPPDRLLEHLPRVDLDDPLAGRFLNGQAVGAQTVEDGQLRGPCRVYQGGQLLGVGEGNPDGQLRPARLIARG